MSKMGRRLDNYRAIREARKKYDPTFGIKNKVKMHWPTIALGGFAAVSLASAGIDYLVEDITGQIHSYLNPPEVVEPYSRIRCTDRVTGESLKIDFPQGADKPYACDPDVSSATSIDARTVEQRYPIEPRLPRVWLAKLLVGIGASGTAVRFEDRLDELAADRERGNE